MKLTIDRAGWLRGDAFTSLLRDDNGCMCALGWYGRSLGIPDDVLRLQGGPATIDEAHVPTWPAWVIDLVEGDEDNGEPAGALIPLESEDAARITCVNDSRSITDEYRERSLKELFARHGIELEFVGEGGPRDQREGCACGGSVENESAPGVFRCNDCGA